MVGCDDRKGFRRMEEGTEEKKSETALRCVAPRGGRRMNEEHHSPGRQAGRLRGSGRRARGWSQ